MAASAPARGQPSRQRNKVMFYQFYRMRVKTGLRTMNGKWWAQGKLQKVFYQWTWLITGLLMGEDAMGWELSKCCPAHQSFGVSIRGRWSNLLLVEIPRQALPAVLGGTVAKGHIPGTIMSPKTQWEANIPEDAQYHKCNSAPCGTRHWPEYLLVSVQDQWWG